MCLVKRGWLWSYFYVLCRDVPHPSGKDILVTCRNVEKTEVQPRRVKRRLNAVWRAAPGSSIMSIFGKSGVMSMCSGTCIVLCCVVSSLITRRVILAQTFQTAIITDLSREPMGCFGMEIPIDMSQICGGGGASRAELPVVWTVSIPRWPLHAAD